MNLRIVILTVLITFLLSACRSSRNAQSSDLKPSPEHSSTSAGLRSADVMVSMVEDAEMWRDISLPVKCKIRAPKNMSISGRATMVKDKIISISLRMLGFEVAGLYVDNDSIIVFEKLNKTMIAEPMAKITEATGLNLANIQDILTGRLCYPGVQLSAENVTELYETALIEGEGHMLRPKKSDYWSYMISEDIPVSLKWLEISLPDRISATCTYEQFQPVIPGFCKSVDIVASVKNNAFDACIEWSLGDAKVDTEAKVSKPSLKGYRRISFSQLIKVLGVR